MKRQFLQRVTMMLLFLVTTAAVWSQTYTVSCDCTDSDGYSCKPSTGDLTTSSGVKWLASTTSTPVVYIKAKGKLANDNSGRIKFYTLKSSGTFNNDITIEVRKDVKISGSSVTNTGTLVGSGSAASGSTGANAVVTLDFSSGTHTYTILLKSGSYTFYTRPITVSAPPDLTITNTTYFGTTSLTQGQSASFTTKIKNNGSSSWSGRLYLKPVGTTDNWVKTNSVITIGSGSTYTFSGSYTPTDAGTYSLGIYYCTDGETSGGLINEGSNNPFTVTVANPKATCRIMGKAVAQT